MTAAPTTVHLGVLVDDDLPAHEVPAELPAQLADELDAAYPGLDWDVTVLREAVGDDEDDSLDLLELTRDRMLDEQWDLAVLLTEHALEQGSHTLPAQISAVHAAGVVSLSLTGRTPQAAVRRVVARLLGLDPDDEDLSTAEVRGAVAAARELATDVEDRGEENRFVYAGRVAASNLRLLTSTIRANRPWTLAAKLSKSMSAALATGALTLITTDLWLLSAEYNAFQMGLVGTVAVVAVTLSIIIGAKLWERPRRREEREQVAIFNLATLASVVIGVIVLHVMLFFAALAGSLLLVDGEVFTEVTGDPATWLQYVKLAWFVGGLATIGSALGAGLEEDDDVRAAIFTRAGS